MLVAQDWGTALAFHLAARRPRRILGLAFMEFIRPFERWEDFHQRPQAREMFKALRTPGVGEKLALEDNVFVEKVLPASVLRTMGDEEMAVYRAPFPTPQSRKPVLRLPRELPIEGQPADVAAISEHDHRALRLSIYPKLLFPGDPGGVDSAERRANSRPGWGLPASSISGPQNTLSAGRPCRRDRPRHCQLAFPGGR